MKDPTILWHLANGSRILDSNHWWPDTLHAFEGLAYRSTVAGKFSLFVQSALAIPDGQNQEILVWYTKCPLSGINKPALRKNEKVGNSKARCNYQLSRLYYSAVKMKEEKRRALTISEKQQIYWQRLESEHRKAKLKELGEHFWDKDVCI